MSRHEYGSQQRLSAPLWDLLHESLPAAERAPLGPAAVWGPIGSQVLLVKLWWRRGPDLGPGGDREVQGVNLGIVSVAGVEQYVATFREVGDLKAFLGALWPRLESEAQIRLGK